MSHRPHAIVTSLVIASLSLGPQGSEARGGAYLVRNINAASDGLSPAAMASFAGSVFFVAGGSRYPRYLWKSDGTAAGTVPVAELGCSYHAELVEHAGSLFIGTGGDWCGELWKTDGTPEGTIRVWDILSSDAFEGARRAHRADSGAPDGLMQFYAVESLTVAGGLLFFVIDSAHGSELWRSDGTEEGTVLVRDIRRGSDSSYPTGLTAVGATLFFTAEDGRHGRELWKSDGSRAGTVMVRDLEPGTASAFPGRYDRRRRLELRAVGPTLYFLASGEAGFGLWRSDGTEEGTLLLRPMWDDDRNPLGELTPFGSVLFFAGCERPKSCGLWRTDGTRAGTRPVRLDLEVEHLTAGARHLFFSGCDEFLGCELWRSDGTESGTSLVRDVFAGPEGSSPSHLTEAGRWLYFVAEDGVNGREPWRSDGTAGGTALVGDLRPGPSGSGADHLVESSGALYFFADDGWHGRELCRVGQSGRARLVGDLETREASSWPERLTAAGGRLFFVADDGWHGRELWTSDGSAAGTYLVADLRPGFDTSWPEPWAEMGGELFFSAFDGVVGEELWRSNGTPRGTTLVRDIRPGPYGSVIGGDYGYGNEQEVVSTGSLLFFAAHDGEHGFELWSSDGSAAGTSMVRDIHPGKKGSHPRSLTAVGRTLFFIADANEPFGEELWKSDGTAAGTVMVRDLFPPHPSGVTRVFATEALDGALFFLTRDGTDTCFWRSDGTARGTREIRCDLRVARIVRAGGALFLGQGPELWYSDGTGVGTRRVRGAIDEVLSVDEMAALGSTLLFAGTSRRFGVELWRSDGTELGTWMVRDIGPGSRGSHLADLTVVDQLAYFTAWDGERDGLWRTDGTPGGTWEAHSFGRAGYVSWGTLTGVDGHLFFAGDDGVLGAELWAVPPSDLLPPGRSPAPGCSGDETVVRAACRHRLRLRLAGAPGQAFQVRLSDGRRQRGVVGEDGRAKLFFRNMAGGQGRGRIIWACGTSTAFAYRCP